MNPTDNGTETKVRLDKWLWAARFFKTRALAKQAVEGGKVRYNSARSKPSKLVELGATLTIPQGWSEKTVTVMALSERRRGAADAAQLYQETEASVVKREQDIAQRKTLNAASASPARRPDKKARRQIVRFKNINDPT